MKTQTNVRQTAGAALIALAVLGFSVPAHAQLTQIQSATGLSAGDATLNLSGSGFVSSPLTQSAGGDAVTFTALNGATFYLQPSDGMSFDFPTGETLLQTETPGASADGPLTISFAQGVSEFGLSAQDNAYDTELFSVAAFNGTTPLGGFSVGPADNSPDLGKSLFLGGSVTGGQSITSIQITSFSSQPEAGNNFFVGPVTFAAPVPEASTLIGFGILLALGGLAVATRRRTAAMK